MSSDHLINEVGLGTQSPGRSTYLIELSIFHR